MIEEIHFLKEDHKGKIMEPRQANAKLGKEIIKEDHVTLLTFMKKQNDARVKMYKANILVGFVQKLFVDLQLDYPGQLDGVKVTKKTSYEQSARSLNQQQLEVFFQGRKDACTTVL